MYRTILTSWNREIKVNWIKITILSLFLSTGETDTSKGNALNLSGWWELCSVRVRLVCRGQAYLDTHPKVVMRVRVGWFIHNLPL